MKMSRLLVILSILLIIFSGCSGESAGGDTPAEKATQMKPVDTAPTASADAPAQPARLSATTQILTINDTPVKWPEFHFWLNYIAKYYKASLGIDKITNWNVDQNGMHLRDFFLATAVGYARKDRAIEAKAAQLGIDLSEKDRAEIEKKRISNIKIYGSELEYRRIVSSMYMSEEVFNYLTRIDYLGNYLFEYFYGAKGEKFSDKEISAYIEDGGYICAKYIFISGKDADGNDLGSKKRMENQRLLEDLLGRLDASDAPLPLFTKLMNEYGEDKTISSYPDGRLFPAGVREKAFETAWLKLKENQYSRIVTTDAGDYIILRMPISPTMTADSAGNTLRYRAAYETFKKQVEDWSTKMKVDYQDAYYKIDVEGIL